MLTYILTMWNDKSEVILKQELSSSDDDAMGQEKEEKELTILQSIHSSGTDSQKFFMS